MEEQESSTNEPSVETGEPETMGEEVGKVVNFLDKISVAIIELSGALKNGDKIRIKGTETDFEQTAESMQIEHNVVESASAGQSIGLKVSSPVKKNDKVYKLD